jgi:hypothetical protein
MRKSIPCRALAAALALSLCGAALAASNDEIQVYDDGINKPGEMGLDVHTNYVASGQTVPGWPGDAPSNHSFRVTPEFSYGLKGNWELGAYLPLLETQDNSTYIEGFKGRLKYLSLKEGSPYYWGLNGELGRVSLRSEPQNWNFELRPILGYHGEKWQFVFNPILDFALSGDFSRVPGFAPAVRVVYSIREDFDIGLEHYAELGKMNNISPRAEQGQNTYAVLDTKVAGHELNFGVGKGWNAASDKWTVKAIVNFPLSGK